jgi:phosphoribosylanthranilate isomerase
MRTVADVEAAIESGADAVGIVLSPSPRQVGAITARKLVESASGHLAAVAVFYHPGHETVRAWHREVGFDIYQAEPTSLPIEDGMNLIPVVHDSELLDIHLAEARAMSTSGLVLVEGKGKGGHGESVNPDRLAAVGAIPDVIIAGGLNPGNVGSVVRSIRPGGVDVSSGIEGSLGVKDHALMHRFVEVARQAEEENPG